MALVRPPTRPTGALAVSGHRVFGVTRHAVRAIDVELDGRRFSARRAEGGWEIDGRRAQGGTAAALEDLASVLAGLRAVDSFRGRDDSSYGLDQPRARVQVTTPRGTRRVTIGDLNPGRAALYARREGDPRTLRIGLAFLNDLERVFFNRDGPRG